MVRRGGVLLLFGEMRLRGGVVRAKGVIRSDSSRRGRRKILGRRILALMGIYGVVMF